MSKLETTRVIAIDGPAGSGKSTVAKGVAQRLGVLYLDSGAVYRAVTLLVLRKKLVPEELNGELSAVINDAKIDIVSENGGLRIMLDGQDVTNEIRSQEVTLHVSAVSAKRLVREVVTRKLHEIVRGKTVVMDGRDIGTAVFPDAELKIFMNASLQERARRRHRELNSAGVENDYEEILQDIARRDKYDSERELAPLRRAANAIELDTTNMTIDDGIDFIVEAFSNKEHQFDENNPLLGG